jgi:hypothetical protein
LEGEPEGSLASYRAMKYFIAAHAKNRLDKLNREET